jgi:hypothetical protein
MSQRYFPEYPSAQELGIDESYILQYGNINLLTRPVVRLKNGDVKKDFSTIIDDRLADGTAVKVIIPSMTDDGVVISELNAKKLYQQTGRHFGKFELNLIAERYQRVLQDKEVTRYQLTIKNNPLYGSGDSWIPVSGITDADKRNLGGIVQLADLTTTEAQRTFAQALTSVAVSYTMDLNPEITINLIDTDYKMFESNYFVIRRDIIYRGRQYEIADVATAPGQGGSPSVTLKCRNKALQRMRRDKTPGSVVGSSGYEYAQNAARKFGMQFLGQKTSKTKSTFKAKTGDGEESVWDVLTRTAGDNQFVVFEVDNTLVYASQDWLLWKFGIWKKTNVTAAAVKTEKNFIPFLYLPGETPQDLAREFLDVDTTETMFELETWPDFSASDNEPLAAQGSCNVLMPNGGLLRPGYTVLVGPYPTYFYGGYLITEVSFNEASPDSAQVSFRTPTEPLNQQNKPIKPRTGTQPGLALGPGVLRTGTAPTVTQNPYTASI